LFEYLSKSILISYKEKLMKNIIAILFLAICQWSSADVVKQLAQAYQYRDVQISPDGGKIALLTLNEGRQALVVLSSDTFKLLGGTNFKPPKEVGDFFWATDERLLISVAQKRGWEEKPSNYGEIFGVNYDGSKGELLFGYSINASSPSLFKGKEASRAWGEPLHRLPDNPDEVLIKSTPMSDGGDRLTEIKRLNIHSGILSKILMAAPISYAKFLTDENGNIITATGTNDDAFIEAFWRDEGADKWLAISPSLIGSQFQPVYYDKASQSIYAISNALTDTTSLIKFKRDSDQADILFNDVSTDISDIIFDSNHDQLLAVTTEKNTPSTHFIDTSSTEAAVLNAMLGAFPGKKVSITSSTRAGDKWIVLVQSDVDTPTFYLFNKEKGQLMQLFKNLSEIPAEAFIHTETFSFKSSDGLDLQGYFTPARDTNTTQPSPSIVLVHGGPRARDTWDFDRLTHTLSQAGYAVIQVNFRGSEGFGKSFMAAGNKHWGDHIQRDIFESSQFAQKQFNLDPKRICIMGASFGAYSSIQSSILYPEHYRCAIANAGIYDLELLKQEGDVPQLGFGKAYLAEAVGNDASQLRMFSPIYNVDKIKAPLLIAHGKQDKRAPYEHAEKLLKALKRSNKKVTTFIQESEGHGFYNPEIREAYFSKVLAFLKRHNPVE
jgi:dienelactone hydrolase